MSAEFRQYMRDELRMMVRDIGKECLGDTQRENARAVAWIEANAARFRAKWVHEHGVDGAYEWGKPCSGAN